MCSKTIRTTSGDEDQDPGVALAQIGAALELKCFSVAERDPVGEHDRAVREYVAHDHAERNHQGLDNAIIAPVPCPTRTNGCVCMLPAVVRWTIARRPARGISSSARSKHDWAAFVFLDHTGATSWTFTPGVGSRYYLVVPTNGAGEGSYGLDGNSMERVVSAAGCHVQSIAPCP